MSSQKNALTLACCLALLVASTFYILFCSAGDGIPSSPEPDQTIYLQYARNIALGQPYVFSAGDAPSTLTGSSAVRTPSTAVKRSSPALSTDRSRHLPRRCPTATVTP